MKNQNNTPNVKLVPDDERLDFMPSKLAGAGAMWFENYLYAYAREMIRGYDGGMWDFYQFSGPDGAGFFWALRSDDRTCHVVHKGNQVSADLSPQVAGVVVTLFALSALVGKMQSETALTHFEALQSYAATLQEWPIISAIID
jgi:hypothetical protein